MKGNLKLKYKKYGCTDQRCKRDNYCNWQKLCFPWLRQNVCFYILKWNNHKPLGFFFFPNICLESEIQYAARLHKMYAKKEVTQNCDWSWILRGSFFFDFCRKPNQRWRFLYVDLFLLDKINVMGGGGKGNHEITPMYWRHYLEVR